MSIRSRWTAPPRATRSTSEVSNSCDRDDLPQPSGVCCCMRSSFRHWFVLVPLFMPVALPALAGSQSLASGVSALRERLSLDRGWLFHEGDIPFPEITGHQPSYDNAKAGSSSGAASPEYDDSAWNRVNLPHDWAVAQPFDAHANISQGYRQRGIGWYRRYFRLDPSDRGKGSGISWFWMGFWRDTDIEPPALSCKQFYVSSF